MDETERAYVSDVWTRMMENMGAGSLRSNPIPLPEVSPDTSPEPSYVSDLWLQMMESMGAGSLRSNPMPLPEVSPAPSEVGECVWFAQSEEIEMDVAECAVYAESECVSENCRWISFTVKGAERERVNAVMSMRSVEGVMNMRLSTLDVVLGVALFVTVSLIAVQSYRCCIRRAQQGLSMSMAEADMDRTPLLDAYHKV